MTYPVLSRCHLFLMGAMFALTFARKGYAIDGLDIRQAQIAQRQGRLEEVLAWHGEFRYVRDTYMEGPEGIAALAQTWVNDAMEWSKSGHELLAMVAQTHTGSGLDSATAQILRDKTGERARGWASLRASAAIIRKRAERGAVLLEERPPLPHDYVEGYSEVLEFSEERYGEALKALRSLASHFDDEALAHWEATISPTAHAISSIITAGQSKHPAVMQALRQVAEAVFLDEQVMPSVRPVEVCYAQIKKHLLNHRIYHAKHDLEKLQTLTKTATAVITATPGDPALQNEYSEHVTRLMKAGEEAVKHDARVIPAYLHVANNLALRVPQLVGDCRDEVKRTLRNCGALRLLAGLQTSHLKEMSDDQLLFIEQTLEKIKEGPL